MQNDPTAYELYKQEHPDRGMGSYILLTFCVMGVILGAVYWLQHFAQLVGIGLFVACLYGFVRLK